MFMFIFLPCLFIKPETLIAKKFLFFNTGVYFEHKHKEVYNKFAYEFYFV